MKTDNIPKYIVDRHVAVIYCISNNFFASGISYDADDKQNLTYLKMIFDPTLAKMIIEYCKSNSEKELYKIGNQINDYLKKEYDRDNDYYYRCYSDTHYNDNKIEEHRCIDILQLRIRFVKLGSKFRVLFDYGIGEVIEQVSPLDWDYDDYVIEV